MSFAAPQLLWLLLVIPPGLLVFFWWAMRKREQLMGKFVAARLLPGLLVGRSRARQRIRHICLLLASVGIVLALAQPQWGFTWQEVKQRGVDIVVAIDCSKSMLAQDIAPNRLARAKLAALELMQKAKSDRLGLVAFAGSAFLACPLTIDDVAFAQSVESLDVNTIGLGGTAIGEAIETSLTAFKEADNHKLLVLMTDGEDHDSEAVKAAEKAAQEGLQIYTIGIGTSEGELVRIQDAQGQPDYVRDEQGNVVKSRLNEQLLAQVATVTKGAFYLLRGAKTIDSLYEQSLSSLPKSEHDQKLVKQYHQRFHWPLSFAILLLIIERLLPERSRTRSAQGVVSRKALAGVTALAAFLAMQPSSFGASPTGALREYRSGRYDQAFKEYEQLLKSKNDDPRLHFNAGAAAYRDGKYADAVKQFEAAIASPDVKLQESAFYNRGNSLFWLGERTPDPQQRKQNWEKALKDFELSSQLNTNDVDAKFNYDFVKQRLEELKQQQQQQQQQQNQDKQDQKNQDQQQNQNQQSKQSKQESQQQDQQDNQQKQNQSQQEQQQQQSEQKQTEQQKPEQQEQQQKQDMQNQEQKSAQASEKEKEEKEKEDQAAAAAGQMTPEQARQLLDSQKGREKMLSQRQQKPAGANKRIKDW